jgi:hypothetical protein
MDGPVATINVTSSGVHTISVWMREDGFRFDKLLLTTDSNYTPTGIGPGESPQDDGGTPDDCTVDSDCDDGNECTNDSCDAGACDNTAVSDGAACSDDGNECTDDLCSAGACGHFANANSCTDDGDSCTDDVCGGGSCTHPDNGSCQSGDGPCAQYCSNPVTFTFSGSYQSGSLGANATCHETLQDINGGVCGNFVSPRSLSVNGVQMSCTGGWPSVPPKVNGGYCIYTSAGDWPWAYFATW